ncbi:hypothetical protein TRVA0_008S01508 [Trichomonascus vanleenenianus]|uniref:uncharacterized protein n=1 Tax=Trichomonascus vanleenenianus TaxID=2268995 RepID=UPI003ECB221F
MLSEFSVEGYSLSLISRTSQVIKYEKGLDIEFISRNVSIDGHAVLSTGLFLLLDASTDWRLLYNPMVHGPPFIKFYAAVALRTKANVPIGVLAIFSPYPRNKVNPSLKHRLESICTRIIEFLDIPPSILSARIESPEETAPIDGCRDMLLTGTAMPADDNIKALLPHDYAIHYDMKTLRKLKNDHTVTQWYQISHELNGCISSRGAVEKASLILKDALGFSLVYAVEVRVSVSYLVPQVKFPYSSGTLCHEIVHLDELFKNETARDVRVRLLGGYGLTKEDSDESMDSEVHCYALESQYGVEYIAPE